MKPQVKTEHVKAGRGGRPSRQDAAQLKDKILDAAAHLFFTHGYGATSIEAVAKQAGMSKRTFYHRFEDKADLFRAVMQRLIERVKPANVGDLFKGNDIKAVLETIAKAVLQAALKPETLALNRLILAEAARFPELALVVNEQGARRYAIEMITSLLQKEIAAGHLRKLPNLPFVAEQFLQMVVSAPQRRAFGLGKPMAKAELDKWAEDTVTLFLEGCNASR